LIDEVKHAFEVGVYPVNLFLLEHTSITLTEVDKMDVNRKMEYFFYITERLKAEKALLDGKTGVGGSNQVNIPTNLPESVTTKINKKISLEDVKEIKRRKREQKIKEV